MPQNIARTRALIGSIALALAGCSSPAERPGAQAQISTDEFSKTIDVDGLLMGENPFFGIKKFYNLVTHVDKQTHAYIHVIETRVDYDADPIDFQFASDDTAQTLKLIPVSHTSRRPCDDCFREEIFNIIVPDEALRAHVATGYRVKVSSRMSDAIILTITPAMIAAQYAGLNAVIAPQGPGQPLPRASSASPGGAQSATLAARAGPPVLGISYMKVLFTSEILIVTVKPNSPADAAGVQPKDILLRYNGRPMTSEKDVQDAVAQTAPGSVVKLEIRRGIEPLTLTAQM